MNGTLHRILKTLIEVHGGVEVVRAFFAVTSGGLCPCGRLPLDVRVGNERLQVCHPCRKYWLSLDEEPLQLEPSHFDTDYTALRDYELIEDAVFPLSTYRDPGRLLDAAGQNSWFLNQLNTAIANVTADPQCRQVIIEQIAKADIESAIS